MMRETLDGLRVELSARLEAEEWATDERLAYVLPAPYATGHLVTLSRPLDEAFIAVSTFSWMWEDERSPLAVVGHRGLAYEPARAVLAAVTDPEVLGVLFSGPQVVVEVAGVGDVREAVEPLSLFVSEVATDIAGVRSVDALIELLRNGRALPFTERTVASLALAAVESRTARAGERADAEEALGVGGEAPADAEAELAKAELITALLAIAGRHDEARRALSEYGPPDREAGLARKYSRFVRQFTRFLETEGDWSPPSTPSSWPPPSAGRTPPLRVSELFAEKVSETRTRHEAVKAVRAVSRGKTRDELRALLEEELDRRDVKIGPRAVESQLDLLATEREPFGRARIVLRSLGALGELAGLRRKTVEPVEEGAPQQPDLTADAAPERDDPPFDLPERAAYPIWGSSHHWVAVELDPAARAWLDRVARHAPQGGGQRPRLVRVWLTRGDESRTIEPCLNVHIGAQRVGWLGPEAGARLRPAMEAAAERDENPWTYAHLTASSGAMPYLLEIALP